MSIDNAAQVAEWNGPQGHRWVEMQAEVNHLLEPFTAALMAAAAAQPGERVIDVGCGCGDTAIALARAVGPAGSVLGVDVSRPMLAAARSLAERGGFANVTFLEADAADAPLPGNADLLFSRLGVMFFSRPGPAFVHLRESLRAGGRWAFVCWRTPRDNPWMTAPLAAARRALAIEAPATDPNAPGAFSLADPDRIRGLLADAGFVAIDVQRFDVPILLGDDPRSAAQGALRLGPTARLAREQGPERAGEILAAVEAALAPVADADGRVRLGASAWIVSATTAGPSPGRSTGRAPRPR